jgi:MraZ protein
MFKGRYEHTVDPKGRVSIPSRFRDILHDHGDQLVITNDFDKCLVAYPLSVWQEFEKTVASKPQFNDSVKILKRFYISGAVECPIDKQGRIILPPTLRDYAEIKKDVIIVGQVNTIEIWNKEHWDAIFKTSKSAFDSKGLSDLGL